MNCKSLTTIMLLGFSKTNCNYYNYTGLNPFLVWNAQKDQFTYSNEICDEWSLEKESLVMLGVTKTKEE